MTTLKDTAKFIFGGYQKKDGTLSGGMTLEDMDDELNRELVAKYMDFVPVLRSEREACPECGRWDRCASNCVTVE